MRLIFTCIALSLIWLIAGLGEEARADGAAPQPDDWITINKDYSSQRYVDLDQITPQNVGKLKEVCEIQLNEPNLFSSGLFESRKDALHEHSQTNRRVRRDDL